MVSGGRQSLSITRVGCEPDVQLHDSPLPNIHSQLSVAAVAACEGGNMKIHGLSIVKNEADILQECFISALDWCDHIYVFDNGSDDGGWELVKELAKQHPQIVPYKQDPVLFRSALRADNSATMSFT